MKKAAKPAQPKKKPPSRRELVIATLREAVAKEQKETLGKKPPAPKAYGRRADLGAPIDGFFAKQQPHLRPILEELRKLVEEAAPDATSSIKWGMPFYTVGGRMMCALAGFKAHVNLILSGPPDTFADPEGRLEGDATTGRHLKLRSLDELPRASVRGWLRAAATLARKQK